MNKVAHGEIVTEEKMDGGKTDMEKKSNGGKKF